MKALIFDVDNTLIDLKKEYMFSVQEVLNDMNYDFSMELVAKIYEYADKKEKY